MNQIVKDTADLMELLPENDQMLAYEIIKKLVLAWDPDFTKVTPAEGTRIEDAEKSMAEEGTISHKNIDWD